MKRSHIPVFGLAVIVTCAASSPAPVLGAGKSKASKTRLSKSRVATSRTAKSRASRKKLSTSAAKPIPRYVSLATLKKWHKQNDPRKMPVALQPLLDGRSLKGQDRQNLATDPPLVYVEAKEDETEAALEAEVAVEEAVEEIAAAEATETAALTETSLDGERYAQAFPRPVAPARPRRTPRRAVTPRWVRYPLEFQLCGIGLGTKVVDKDRFNRIDRYGLFAIHGNPTSVVTPTAVASTVISVMQTPPELPDLFPGNNNPYLPHWASAIIAPLDGNHVQWLYRRDTYAMGFTVDRLGFVDAIVVAGEESPIARTQLEDPVHTVKLGDDLRKVLYRYGYPDQIATYKASGNRGGGDTADVQLVPEDGVSGLFNADKSGGGGTADSTLNTAFRTFEFRYEQSYNIVFTIRNNRVVRMYIYGDPDFFNQQRRNALRREY